MTSHLLNFSILMKKYGALLLSGVLFLFLFDLGVSKIFAMTRAVQSISEINPSNLEVATDTKKPSFGGVIVKTVFHKTKHSFRNLVIQTTNLKTNYIAPIGLVGLTLAQIGISSFLPLKAIAHLPSIEADTTEYLDNKHQTLIFASDWLEYNWDPHQGILTIPNPGFVVGGNRVYGYKVVFVGYENYPRRMFSSKHHKYSFKVYSDKSKETGITRYLQLSSDYVGELGKYDELHIRIIPIYSDSTNPAKKFFQRELNKMLSEFDN